MIQRYDFLQCALSRVWTEDNPWQKQDYRSMSSRCMVAMDDGEPSLRGLAAEVTCLSIQYKRV